jgi:hypothetical protein
MNSPDLVLTVLLLILAAPFSTASGADYKDRVSFGEDVDIGADDTVTGDVVVIGADARIAGSVTGDVVVVGGDLHLAPTARIGGDAVPIGGKYTREGGATVAGATVVVDASMPGAAALGNLGGHKGASRPIEPTESRAFANVAGVAGWGAGLACLLVLGLLFQSAWPERSRNLRRTVEASPGSSLLVGSLVSLGLFFVILLLTISLIGIPAVPFVALAASAVWLIGITALCEAVGDRLPLPESARSRMGSFVAGVLVFAVVGGLWFVGFVGAVVAVVGVILAGSLAMGASVLSRLGHRPFPT